MKHTFLHIFVVASLVGAVFISSCSGKKKGQSESEGVTEVEVASPMVDSVTLHKSYPGLLSSNSTVNVVGRVNGQVLSKTYTEGDYVKKGQVLFTIEPTLYQDALAQAQSTLANAQSEYDYASKNYNAMEEALKQDAVAEISVIQAKSDMEQAQASIKDAKAALETARTNLGYCTVTAPISGKIVSGSYDVGAYISGSGAPVTLATIYDDSTLNVVFSLEENQYDILLNADKQANKRLYDFIPLVFKEDLPHSYTAKLNYSSPTVDTSTGTIELKGVVDNPYGELRNGMYVTVQLPYGTAPKALLIPDASIGTDQLGKYVYVVNDSNRVVYTPIKVGDIYHENLRIVEEGLTPESRYVTKALLTVRNGEEVKPVEAAATDGK